MSVVVFLSVLLAALLHASWNALLKSGADKHLSMAAVVIGQALFAVPVLFFVPAPAPASFGWLAAGVMLHLGYQLFLMASYRIGDLTQVYPIARGVAPLIVAGVSVAFLGVVLEGLQLLAIVVIATGIMSLALVRRADGQRNARAGAFALATGCFIAAYSLVDGLGAREAGTALGFYGWLTIGNAAAFVVVASVRHRGMLVRLPRDGVRIMAFGGGASYAAYALVVWSFTQAPIALVTALRETSIVFALLIGVFALGEKLDLFKLFATAMTILGAAFLRLARA